MLELRLKCSINNTNNIQEGFMIRHLVFTALFATASFANAGTVEASSATVQPAWSFNSGLSGSGEMAASQSMIAGPGTWYAHSKKGDIGSSSTMLFSQRGPALLGSTSTGVQADAPASASNSGVSFDAGANAGAAITAPAATDMPAIVVNADVIVSADAIAPAAIPEPATGMLMLAGLLGAGFLRRRRN